MAPNRKLVNSRFYNFLCSPRNYKHQWSPVLKQLNLITTVYIRSGQSSLFLALTEQTGSHGMRIVLVLSQ